jgi:uncharacterized metal-binding protein
MPSGKTHDTITKYGTVPAAAIALYYTHDITLSEIATGAFFVSGYMLSPDLDLPHSYPTQRWGHMKFIWRGYRKRIATRHRHPLSHGPIIGVSARIVYLMFQTGLFGLSLLAVSALVFALANGHQHVSVPGLAIVDNFVSRLQHWDPLVDFRVWSLAIGMEAGAASHYIPDYLVKGHSD